MKSENHRFKLLLKCFRLHNSTFGDQKQELQDFIDLVQQDSHFFNIKKICWQQNLLRSNVFDTFTSIAVLFDVDDPKKAIQCEPSIIIMTKAMTKANTDKNIN